MTTTSPNDLRMPADVGRYTIAKSFEVTARSITAFAGGVENGLDLLPALGGHGWPSSRSSHKRAVCHSRLTVDGELARVLAVSSMVRPPK